MKHFSVKYAIFISLFVSTLRELCMFCFALYSAVSKENCWSACVDRAGACTVRTNWSTATYKLWVPFTFTVVFGFRL